MAEPARYADNWSLRLVRRVRSPEERYRRAAALQERYRRLADEAGEIKMNATVDVHRETLDVEETARRVNRDTRWVSDVLRILSARSP